LPPAEVSPVSNGQIAFPVLSVVQFMATRGARWNRVSRTMLQSALVLTRESGTQLLSNEEMGYQYRSSIFKREHKSVTILEVHFRWSKS